MFNSDVYTLLYFCDNPCKYNIQSTEHVNLVTYDNIKCQQFPFVHVAVCNLHLYEASSVTDTTQHRSWCRLAMGGFYNQLPFQGHWFGMALDVFDTLRGCAGGVEVGRERT